ncbi:MAG: hypothetical protein RMX65_024815 [Nostoc sp. DedQUE01]
MSKKYNFRTVPDILASSPGFELAFAMNINLPTLFVITITDFGDRRICKAYSSIYAGKNRDIAKISDFID